MLAKQSKAKQSKTNPSILDTRHSLHYPLSAIDLLLSVDNRHGEAIIDKSIHTTNTSTGTSYYGLGEPDTTDLNRARDGQRDSQAMRGSSWSGQTRRILAVGCRH